MDDESFNEHAQEASIYWRDATVLLGLDPVCGLSEVCVEAAMDVDDCVEKLIDSFNTALIVEEEEELLNIARRVSNQKSHSSSLVSEETIQSEIAKEVKKHKLSKERKRLRLSEDRKNAHEYSMQTIYSAVGTHYTIAGCCVAEWQQDQLELKDTLGHATELAKMSAPEKKTIILSHLNTEYKDPGDKKKMFKLSNKTDLWVCEKCFCTYYQTSSKTLQRYRNDLKNGTTERGDPRRRSISNATRIADHWITKQVKIYGEYQPHTEKIHLNFISKQWMYEKYKASMHEQKETPVSSNTFNNLFNEFNNVVKIVKYCSFAKCDDCAELTKFKQSGNKRVRDKAKAEYLLHMQEVKNDNAQLTQVQADAKEKPDKVTSLGLDGMQQVTTRLPYMKIRNKDLDARVQLPAAIYGGIVHGDKPGPIVFMSWGDVCKDSSYTAQAILRCLKLTMEQRGILGAKLVLNLDGTTRENKNSTIVKLCAAMVEFGIFTEVWVFYKMPGHTHNEVDQFWSRISQKLREHGAWDGAFLINSIKHCYTYMNSIRPTVIDDMEVSHMPLACLY